MVEGNGTETEYQKIEYLRAVTLAETNAMIRARDSVYICKCQKLFNFCFHDKTLKCDTCDFSRTPEEVEEDIRNSIKSDMAAWRKQWEEKKLREAIAE